MPKEAVARARVVEVEDDEDDFRKRARENQRDKKDNGLFKLPEGETTFRILRTPGDKQRSSPSVWIEYYVHRNVGPKKRGPLRCGLSVADDSGSCWLCKVVDKLREQGKTLAAADLERKKVYAVQVAVWSNEDQTFRGPLLWITSAGKSSRSLSYKLESIIAAPASKRYIDHDDGYNFSIDRSGTGMLDTTYTSPERSEDRSAVPKGILSKLKSFVDIIASYDKENQKKAYYGEGETAQEEEAPRRRRVEEEDEEEVPRSKPKAKILDEDEEDSIDSEPEVDDEDDEKPVSKKSKSKVEDEDDENLQFGDEDSEDSEDSADVDLDDEEDTPKAKAGKKAKKVVEEDEDDLESSESDDEEEVAPKPKKRR